MLKKIGLAILGLLIILLVIYHELVFYGLSQAKGQVSIIWNARPVEDFLIDKNFPDSLKAKIRLVQEIRQFAFDSLGINHSDNYTTMYDQKGEALLWVVTASDPFLLKEKEWSFPFLGAFSYKGFFKRELADEEEAELKKLGFDTSVDEVEGWSTLGWFKDPILSDMLDKTPGSLANLIIHELTHGTLYVKNNVQYNENLASFVGDKGALMFLEYKYGRDSDEYNDYVKRKDIWKNYSKLVLRKAEELDTLYRTFSSLNSVQEKAQKKKQKLQKIIAEFKDHLSYFRKRDPAFFSHLDSINNTYFIDFRRYREDQDVFEDELNEKFGGDFRKYFIYLKEKYPSL
jgi:predicted aminopeptidase